MSGDTRNTLLLNPPRFGRKYNSIGCFVMSSILVIGWSFHEDPEGAAHEAQKQLGLETPALAELGEKRSAELPAGAAAQGGRSAKYKAKGANPPAAPTP